MKFEDIVDAFDFVSSAQMHENQALLNKETGTIHLRSAFVDDFCTLPNDIDDEKYIEIPHKNELELGESLVLEFAKEYFPSEVNKVKEVLEI